MMRADLVAGAEMVEVRRLDNIFDTCLAAAGGKRTDAAAVRGDGTPDCSPTGGDGAGGIGRQKTEEGEVEGTWKS